MKSIHLIALLVLSFFCFSLNAQTELISERFAFEPDLGYNESIQSPSDFLGHDLGESFTLYANCVNYFKYLADASDRVSINQYGQTYEGRKLYNLVITSPENHKNIESIRSANLQLGDPRSISVAQADEIISNKPVFVSYSYNIHGNEASSTEAAMQVSYRYAAATDVATAETLNNAVLIFYICINPDGRDRFAYWFESVKRSIPATEPTDLEHMEPWPGGRTNHYWFDLNRDWVWGVHPESRGHTAEYLRWMPQIHTDYHEQGYNSNYFTMPGTTPRNLLLPDDYEGLSDTIGMANIAAFNKNRINYFTREAFDFFYPGYGSSYPSVMNAIGMLTEQGGGASRAIETDDGYILTLQQRIWDHYTTSVATIDKAVDQKELFNRYFYNSSNPANSKLPTKAYILEDRGDVYVSDVINMLIHHGVEVEKSTASFQLTNAYSFRTQELVTARCPSGSYIIRLNQPKHLFINSVFSPQMAIEDSVMYDMSTWSAPLAYNLEAFSTNNRLTVKTERVAAKIVSKGSLNNPESQYAYVIEWDQRTSPRALAMLWEKDYRVRSAEEPFSTGTLSFNPGTLIILQGRNLHKKDTWIADMEQITKETGVQIHGLNTGRMVTGNDLASRKSRPLKKPKVALLVDRPFSAYTCGQIYFLFDQETKLPISRIPTGAMQQSSYPGIGGRSRSADLNDYDVLILAGGGNNLNQVFEKEKIAEIKQWVQSGGTLIAVESAAPFFAKKEKEGFSNIALVTTPKDTTEEGKYLSYADREGYFGKKRVPGAALNAHMDTSHPLSFGIKENVFALKFGNQSFKPAVDVHSVGRYAEDVSKLLASGYASGENLELLAGNSFATVQPMGSGNLVLLLDNPHYRMFWRGPSRMMQNAVMLLPSF